MIYPFGMVATFIHLAIYLSNHLIFIDICYHGRKQILLTNITETKFCDPLWKKQPYSPLEQGCFAQSGSLIRKSQPKNLENIKL